VAAAREATRDDRVRGMAASQATLVHRGVIYDIEIDTTRTSPGDCAQIIVDRIGLNAGRYEVNCSGCQGMRPRLSGIQIDE
jgi:hypothetical protein